MKMREIKKVKLISSPRPGSGREGLINSHKASNNKGTQSNPMANSHSVYILAYWKFSIS